MILATTNENCFLLCPICRKKTKTKVLQETELTNFPLYCSRCKTATKVNYFNARAYSQSNPVTTGVLWLFLFIINKCHRR